MKFLGIREDDLHSKHQRQRKTIIARLQNRFHKYYFLVFTYLSSPFPPQIGITCLKMS